MLLSFDGKPKCEIVCPFDSCQDSTKLNLIKQASLFAPLKLNTHNFERHINTKHLNRKRKCDEEKKTPKKKLVDNTQFDIIDCDISTRTENASGLILGTFSSTPIRQKFLKDQSQFVTPKTLKIVMLGEQLSTENNIFKELENNQTTKNATTSLSGPTITPKSARIDKLSDGLIVSKEVASKLRKENFLLRYKYTDALSRIQTTCRIKPLFFCHVSKDMPPSKHKRETSKKKKTKPHHPIHGSSVLFATAAVLLCNRSAIPAAS